MQSTLAPLLEFCSKLDLFDPSAATRALEEAFPFDGEWTQGLGEEMREGVDSGSLCDHGHAPVQWSRVFSSTEETHGLSCDAVLMSASGPRHRHPEGEIDLCFSMEGEPLFDGHPPGWVVYGPDSTHVPTVSGGTMLILYLLPSGAIEFLGA